MARTFSLIDGTGDRSIARITGQKFQWPDGATQHNVLVKLPITRGGYTLSEDVYLPPTGEGTHIRQLQGSVVNKVWTIPQEYYTPEPVIVIPSEVTRTQALLALLTVNIKESDILALVNAIVDETERETARIYFNAATWEREHPFVIMFGTTLGMTDSQIDDLFILAKSK